MKATKSRRRHRGPWTLRHLIGSITVSVALVATGSVLAAPAYADDYPTWEDVQAAQANESSKQSEIQRIQGLIASLRDATAAAQSLSIQRGTEYQEAQTKYDTASFKADELDSQAAAAQATADASIKQAGQLAALMAKSGGNGLSVNLFTSESSEADGLLYQLGAMSQLTGSASKLYATAEQDKNTAQSLTDQAVVARDALKALADEAEAARNEAIAAQKSLEESLAAQQTHEVQLETQLAVLTQNRQATEADYNAGVEARRVAEEARKEAERQAAAAAAAAAAASGGGGGGGGGDSSGPGPVSSGWASPFPGSYSTDEYGMRTNPVTGNYTLHAGLDLNYNSGTCGAPVYAAAAGEVSYAGYNGGYGNFVEINHGGGVRTGYGHNTSLNVGSGQYVAAGEIIAFAGTTGNSTGCHVHFEVRVGGDPTDPRPFMADRGVYFG
ncbi:M23 family metallopeptidase [Agreia pratensis]|uniref:Murein DD-endopeptidase MepM and murein hydrolase activator NlpD, contain LysM domain n=1 Tax=Agreia pratensis TaxID=150121 RepID=A0A1X7JN63_9MICO|nr:M23 family metallopeptidase [Agreia pratensis]SMG29434.1 Murein DD-endopeptidase MepM and murein hydrolase activator NlpD, contain LysM domain [Agreia pratensis]